MAESTPQNLSNHARFVPAWHCALFPAAGIVVIYALVSLVRMREVASLFGLAQALILFGAVLYGRLFALAAQDRVIRLEEQLRMRALFPNEANGMIEKLEPRQYIALRFASDGELLELTRAAIDSQLSEKEIKTRVKNWRADHHRV